jgi:hypothetical protein
MSSWFRLLDNARNSEEAVGIVRDYLARWSPEEIALLPDACRPPHIRDESDVENLHRAAVEAYRGSRASGEALRLLAKLTGFIACASVRLAQLRPPGLGEAPTTPAGAQAGR